MSHGLQTAFGKSRWAHDDVWRQSAYICYQTNLPADAKPLTFCIYADKTKLSTFGTQKGYPVIARCTNLPVEIRNGNGIGGGRVVGWLPIVSLFYFHCDSHADSI